MKLNKDNKNSMCVKYQQNKLTMSAPTLKTNYGFSFYVTISMPVWKVWQVHARGKLSLLQCTRKKFKMHT